jgi:AcrR family transcriptional regulator
MSRLAVPDQDDESPKDLRRAQILDAARLCFARSGFHGASMQQVCAEAKMSPGALYRYFPSKEAIIEAIAEEERLKAAGVMAVLQEPGAIIDRLMRSAEAYFALMRRPGGAELMLEICSESMRNTGVGGKFAACETDALSLFRVVIEDARQRGEIDPTLDVEAAVLVLFAIGDGLAMRMSMDRELDLDRMLPILRRVLLGVLRPSGVDPAGRASGTETASPKAQGKIPVAVAGKLSTEPIEALS